MFARAKAKCLVAVCETSHTGHDTEDVVVGGEDGDLASGAGPLRAWRRELGGVGEVKDKLGVVDTGHVAGTAGLVFLRSETE